MTLIGRLGLKTSTETNLDFCQFFLSWNFMNWFFEVFICSEKYSLVKFVYSVGSLFKLFVCNSKVSDKFCYFEPPCANRSYAIWESVPYIYTQQRHKWASATLMADQFSLSTCSSSGTLAVPKAPRDIWSDCLAICRLLSKGTVSLFDGGMLHHCGKCSKISNTLFHIIFA